MSAKGGFEQLQDEVASAAFHNSAQRVDPPKCHPNTRDAVLQHIMRWIRASKDRQSWILWLNGAAGAGKSAIAQTIAEMCEEERMQLASFFFFRADETRNTPKHLIATLAYQLAHTIPATRDIITKAVESDPLIFQRSLEIQLERLVVNPLRQIRELNLLSSTSPFLFIIDGIDECDKRLVQINILNTISKAIHAQGIPAIFLVASRNESQITMTFNSKGLLDIVTRIALDDDYLSDDDISLFLNEKFAELKETHPLQHLIPETWPSPDLVQALVEKSSGQFIYASVVIKFVSAPNSHPVQRLEMVRGIRPTRLDTPFAQLDALYQHIFSSVDDIEGTLPVLAYSILMRHTDIPMITKFLGLSEGTVETALVDLTSVIACKDGHVIYLHASLPDFLLDATRSQQYHVNPVKWHTEFAHRWLTLQSFGALN
ncbi:hypothetical protein BJ912DRAFT_951483 [Pholiota molesta]|nr:hypothetical protein BJ912DRAFT_951483 [Pholiota molesta]